MISGSPGSGRVPCEGGVLPQAGSYLVALAHIGERSTETLRIIARRT